jgi:hypothetical protein
MWLGRMARLRPDGHGLSRALDGDTTILPPATADELIAEVSCRDAWQYARLMRHAQMAVRV